LIFSAAADILSELKMISDEKSREEMIAKLPKQLQAATCIGCGLELAVQVILYISSYYYHYFINRNNY
jgi:hypothetical protein